LALFDIARQRFIDHEVGAVSSRRLHGRYAKREETYIPSSIDDEVGMKVLIEMVRIAGAEFESPLKVAPQIGDT
jgi:hypothetical protein